MVIEIQGKMKETQEESDLNKYQIQEQAKEITEHKLKIDVLKNKIDSLISEKTHGEVQKKEAIEFRKVYEKKADDTWEDYQRVFAECNEVKTKLVGFEEILKEREERLEKYKSMLDKTEEDLAVERDLTGTLKVELDKTDENCKNARNDLEDVVEKLHQTNRARHEIEIRLKAE